MRLRQTLGALSTVILSSVIAFAGPAQQGAGDRVAGRVLSSPAGRPLANVLVSLEETRSNHTFATVYTGEGGSFHFDRVPAGKYRLLGQASGFVASLYLEHEGGLSTAIVTGAGVDTSSLTLELTPAASISGHIIDDTGEPVVRANIILYRKQPGDEGRIVRFRNGFTNDENTFDFGNLPPGRYFLAATAMPWYAVHQPPPEPPEASVMFRSAVDPALDVAYPMTFYPAATRDTDASPIDVKPGDEFIADIHFAPVHALSITLPSADNGVMNQGGRLFGYSLMRTVFGHAEPAIMQMEGFNGTQRITGLAPGQYELRGNLQGAGSRDFGSITLSSESITLGSQPAATASALVHVSLHAPEGMDLPKNTLITLYQRGNPSGVNLNQPLAGKDTVDFNEVPVGEYRFGIYDLGRSLSVAGVQVNGKDSPTRVLHVTGTDEVKVDLTLGDKPISIDGYVRRPDGKLSVPSMVILVPAGEDTSPDLFRRDQTDLDGSFTLPNVLPGNYLLIAVDDAWRIRWNDATAVMPYLLHAVPIAVRTDGGAQPIHLNQPVISQAR